MKLNEIANGHLRRQPKFGLPKQVWQPQEKKQGKHWYDGKPKKGVPYRPSSGSFKGKAEAYDEHIIGST